MNKRLNTIVENIIYSLTFIFLIIIPGLFWNASLYIIDGGENPELQLLFGLLNYMYVPIETITIVIFNLIGFCILKRHKIWKIVTLVYLTISFAASLLWIISQFNRVFNDGTDQLGLIFCNGPNYLRDVFYICLYNILSEFVAGIVAISDGFKI